MLWNIVLQYIALTEARMAETTNKRFLNENHYVSSTIPTTGNAPPKQ
jgi:hypothetical protein